MQQLKKYLPHLIAIGAFLMITLVYFSPLLSGKVVMQSDIANWQGMSKSIDDFRNNITLNLCGRIPCSAECQHSRSQFCIREPHAVHQQDRLAGPAFTCEPRMATDDRILFFADCSPRGSTRRPLSGRLVLHFQATTLFTSGPGTIRRLMPSATWRLSLPGSS
jgi:hypothetical protein